MCLCLSVNRSSSFKLKALKTFLSSHFTHPNALWMSLFSLLLSCFFLILLNKANFCGTLFKPEWSTSLLSPKKVQQPLHVPPYCSSQKIPQQTNENDCGVFVLEVRYIFKNTFCLIYYEKVPRRATVSVLFGSILGASPCPDRSSSRRRTSQRYERGSTKSSVTASCRIRTEAVAAMDPAALCRKWLLSLGPVSSSTYVQRLFMHDRSQI